MEDAGDEGRYDRVDLATIVMSIPFDNLAICAKFVMS